MSRVGAWLRARPVDGWTDPGLSLVLAALYTAVLLGTVDGLGYTRDEGFYFHAAQAYQGWLVLLWESPARALEQVDAFWRVNHEHPALLKSLFALSHLFGFEKMRLFEWEGTSYRFPAMALSGLGVGLTYLWGARAESRLTGLVAAGGLAALPRFFFHAHLACFDAPVVTLWMLTAYHYWRAMARGSAGRALLAGAAFGLALNTKHNAWFLPIVCGVHAGLLQVPGIGAAAARARSRWRAVVVLGTMAVIGPLVLYTTWPWLWHEPLGRLREYALFHLHHDYYNMEFLGRNYFQPPMPRAYAPLMTIATVPVVLLVLSAVGAWPTLRRLWATGWALWQQRSSPAWSAAATPLLWLLAVAVQYGAWLSPTTPIFGGTKHWMTAYPFLLLMAGTGLSRLVRRAAAWARRDGSTGWRGLASGALLPLAAAGCVLVGPTVQALRAHPWGLTAYTPVVGGAPGAATLGLNRGFWGHTTGALLRALDGVEPGARIYIHDTLGASWDMLARDGRLRRDLRAVPSVAGADYALYHHEKHMSGQEYQAWVAMGTVAPTEIAGLDGVPVIWLYRRAEIGAVGEPSTGSDEGP